MPSTQEQRHSLKGVSRRVFVLLLLPLLVSLAGMGAYLSRRITQLEAAVWEHSEFAGLERSESLMQALVSSQIIPGFLRHRASGLLGDLAYHRKDFKTALAYYGQSMGRHKGSDFSNLLQFVPSALQSPGDFHRGFRDHSASPPRQLPLNDADLELVPPSKSGDAEA